MASLSENIDHFQNILKGTSCKLVAVSKTKPVAMLQEAYDSGIRVFGENKVQELKEKSEVLPKDIEWHMIGHLQSNKVKFIAPFVSMIHGVDSFKLLKEINKRAAQNDKVIPCLFQIHIAKEESKFGLSEEELFEILNSETFKNLSNIKMNGLMGMATYTENKDTVRNEFKSLKTLFDKVQNSFSGDNLDFTEISMGMSGDFQIALEEGSTMIRVGSAIFGSRN
ncbi:MAG: YggS family pyridoxal phosphate-dependent enzyme [Flammeovirgaceae bacterium]|nr:YggS family pyridoxal phosphate-dependent enzyme [Flammeovirgaceae bacterium]